MTNQESEEEERATNQESEEEERVTNQESEERESGEASPFLKVNKELQRDVVYLGWPIAPAYMSPNAGVSANECSCAVCTWGPN